MPNTTQSNHSIEGAFNGIHFKIINANHLNKNLLYIFVNASLQRSREIVQVSRPKTTSHF